MPEINQVLWCRSIASFWNRFHTRPSFPIGGAPHWFSISSPNQQPSLPAIRDLAWSHRDPYKRVINYHKSLWSLSHPVADRACDSEWLRHRWPVQWLPHVCRFVAYTYNTYKYYCLLALSHAESHSWVQNLLHYPVGEEELLLCVFLAFSCALAMVSCIWIVVV
jgi:hypothetical protein